MKNQSRKFMQTRKLSGIFTITMASLVLAACATQVRAPEGSAAVRTRLTLLQANAELASLAPIEIQDAALAVTAAEQPRKDPALERHLVLIADKKVDIASAWAQSRLYEDQRADLSAQSEAARLESRTREADRARNDADIARSDADRARDDANAARNQAQAARNNASVAQAAANNAQDQAAAARGDANVARADATAARSETELARGDTEAANALTEDLQRQLADMNARNTDRGMVITLGDVLFETGKAELRGGAPVDLDKLATFLKRYDTRTVLIEGHTDNVGSESSNLSLSQLRAGSVEAYLMKQGIVSSRMSATGQGEGNPVASNEAETGRQQNRRVEVIISNATQ